MGHVTDGGLEPEPDASIKAAQSGVNGNLALFGANFRQFWGEFGEIGRFWRRRMAVAAGWRAQGAWSIRHRLSGIVRRGRRRNAVGAGFQYGVEGVVHRGGYLALASHADDRSGQAFQFYRAVFGEVFGEGRHAGGGEVVQGLHGPFQGVGFQGAPAALPTARVSAMAARMRARVSGTARSSP